MHLPPFDVTSPPSIPPHELVRVTLTTHLGAVYEVPDMTRAQIEQTLTEDWALGSSLTLVNVSQAVLVLPFRILASIAVNGELKWRAP